MARGRRKEVSSCEEVSKRVVKTCVKKKRDVATERREHLRKLLQRFEPAIEQIFQDKLQGRQITVDEEVITGINALLVDLLERLLTSAVKVCEEENRRVLGASELRKALERTLSGRLRERCEQRASFVVNLTKSLINLNDSSNSPSARDDASSPPEGSDMSP